MGQDEAAPLRVGFFVGCGVTFLPARGLQLGGLIGDDRIKTEGMVLPQAG